ncbi:hypothetical protein EYF80_057725 [Liparis tanakae]|uniref:Uncharacterized protein n=1 Tax=Liparis tanakae TaxID=230148 RepID=A0A4Z2EUR8_9TELE|nr:hypothetical protein EYF80_057725 [Liparis tanakae]
MPGRRGGQAERGDGEPEPAAPPPEADDPHLALLRATHALTGTGSPA